jgi:hypothetical protein
MADHLAQKPFHFQLGTKFRRDIKIINFDSYTTLYHDFATSARPTMAAIRQVDSVPETIDLTPSETTVRAAAAQLTAVAASMTAAARRGQGRGRRRRGNPVPRRDDQEGVCVGGALPNQRLHGCSPGVRSTGGAVRPVRPSVLCRRLRRERLSRSCSARKRRCAYR